MDIVSLKRQHSEVMDLANYILNNIKKCTVDENIHEIAQNINTITGKLKIHLLNEDKYLYPYLLNSPDKALNTFGKKYSEEMKKVTEAYENYKSKYNTSNKIRNNIEGFKQDTIQIFKVLSDRIDREEKELYPLL
ncbi:hemerythrin domain-containing protein [Clostridium sp. 001]|uniref:hemerythrin domain-containing protein n=1 Tax=Clostridium sp. 001 TaxID=1970093 RepID=UPI001C2BAEDE|nr:hemerythrin domain-containing protein [Clostridium sp. 001]QXE19630.1 hypothetical protein B5S50_12800 [Clostridium sp. 001]